MRVPALVYLILGVSTFAMILVALQAVAAANAMCSMIMCFSWRAPEARGRRACAGDGGSGACVANLILVHSSASFTPVCDRAA